MGAAKNIPKLHYYGYFVFMFSLALFTSVILCLPARILFLDRLSVGLDSQCLFFFTVAVSPSIAITCLTRVKRISSTCVHFSPPPFYFFLQSRIGARHLLGRQLLGHESGLCINNAGCKDMHSIFPWCKFKYRFSSNKDCRYRY